MNLQPAFVKILSLALALVTSPLAFAGTEEVPGVTVQPDSYFYTGKPYDADLGAYVFAYRNYDVSINRWTSADSSGFPDGANSHRYASTPTTGLDPDGLTDVSVSVTWTVYFQWDEDRWAGEYRQPSWADYKLPSQNPAPPGSLAGTVRLGENVVMAYNFSSSSEPIVRTPQTGFTLANLTYKPNSATPAAVVQDSYTDYHGVNQRSTRPGTNLDQWNVWVTNKYTWQETWIE